MVGAPVGSGPMGSQTTGARPMGPGMVESPMPGEQAGQMPRPPVAELAETAELRVGPMVRQRRDMFDALIALGAGVGLPAALRRITEVARDVTGARYGVFAATAASRGSVPAVLRAGVAEQPPEPMLADMLRDPAGMLGVGSLLRIDDLRAHPRRTELPVDLPAGIAMLATPILAEGELYGGLMMFGHPGQPFTVEHEDALITVSAATGVVIATAALRADAERRQRWLDASADVVTHLLAAESSESVLELVAQRAREVADADAAAILEPGAADVMTVAAAVGAPAAAMAARADEAAGGHVAEVLRTGLPRLLDMPMPATQEHWGGSASWSSWSPEPGPAAGYGWTVESMPAGEAAAEPGPYGAAGGPCMLVPFSAENRPLGVLVVARMPGRPAFGDADLAMASMFAGHAALAVELAHAHRDREWLAVLEDRDRIARDLHDVVIQRLFVAGLRLQSTTRSIQDAAVVTAIEGTVDELDHTVTEIRRSIFSLSSPLTGRDGLRTRLLGLCATAAGMLGGAEPQVRLDGPLDMVVPAPVADHVTAVLREALANVTRHAQASEISVQAHTDGVTVWLEVTDNGVGMTPGTQPRSGLADMAARAENLGGSMRISSGPAGTSVHWEVPLHLEEAG
jgi:signal transduction histidine kinase